MATITERFGFTKPAGSDPASVVPLNSNIDLIELYLGRTQDSIAPLYDDTETYSAGDLRTYESRLYKCNTDISTPETFDPEKWDLTTAVQEGGGSGGASAIEKTLSEYNALTPAQKENGSIYMVQGEASLNNRIFYMGTEYANTNGGSGGGGNASLEATVLYDTPITANGTYTLADSYENYDFISIKAGNGSNETDVHTYAVDDIKRAMNESKVITNPNTGGWFNFTISSNELTIPNKTVHTIYSVVGYKIVGGGGGSSEAEDINYDNTTSQLTADNVQEAIDEVVAKVGTASENILTLQNVQGYDKYDETQTYAVGDYAIYNNHVYECTTAVSTAEPFDSTKWTATSIEQIIDGVKGDVTQLNSSKANKLSYQRYTVNFGTCTNNTDYDKTLNIARDGYTILGIVDFNILGSYGTHFHISRMSIDNFATLHIKIRANSTTAFTTDNTRVDVLILYVAN